MLPAVLSGLLLEMGEDPSKSPELRGRYFPAGWIESSPALLRSGFPVTAWRMVAVGILSLEKSPTDPTGRWRVNAGRMVEHFGEWYEMGEQLLFRNLAKALLPLILEQLDVTIAIAGLSAEVTRHWIRCLRQEWNEAGLSAEPHLVKV